MKALWVDSNGVLNARAGTYINDSIAEAIELSANEGRLVTFYACWGVTVNVRADSNAELILRDWERAADEKIPKNIGPYPTPDLSREERKSDMRINAANLNDWRTREVARKAENRAKREAFETKFASVPIELIDTAWWDELHNMATDDSDKELLAIAGLWARLMQLKIANGEKLEEVAWTTLVEACMNRDARDVAKDAVAALSLCWKYGEQLERLWSTSQTRKGVAR